LEGLGIIVAIFDAFEQLVQARIGGKGRHSEQTDP
jgi:hypothetical protein